MPAIKTLFWDVGGVLLSDAWDHTQRAQALKQFGLNESEFQERHEPLVPAFERGELSLDEYLDRTVFYRERPFGKQSFRDYMFSLSIPKPDRIALVQELKRSGKYFMGTLNNESTELNLYRIRSFGLREVFGIFVSSCFVRLRKPESGIYQLALQLTQEAPEKCCFLDDRPPNLEPAARLGMHTIQVTDTAQLRVDLNNLGILG